MNLISLSQAFEQWSHFDAGIPSDDRVALAESWNDYTDSLAKDGQLSALQYHHAPAYDDPMPGHGSTFDPLHDDREFILGALGVTIESRQIDTRPGADQWDANATHWRVTVLRGTKAFGVNYSMGSALQGEPDLQGVISALLSDSECADDSFASWCADYGLDTDSRNARVMWRGCRNAARYMRHMFTAAELDDLRELFEGY